MGGSSGGLDGSQRAEEGVVEVGGREGGAAVVASVESVMAGVVEEGSVPGGEETAAVAESAVWLGDGEIRQEDDEESAAALADSGGAHGWGCPGVVGHPSMVRV